MQEYSASFWIAIPADLSKASGVLFYEVLKSRAGTSARRDGSRGGDGGSFQVWTYRGCQRMAGGILALAAGVETITAPVAKGADGSPLTGPVLVRFSPI